MLYIYNNKAVRSDFRELTKVEVISITETKVNTCPVFFTLENENFFHVTSNLQHIVASYQNIDDTKKEWERNFKKTNDNFWKVIDIK